MDQIQITPENIQRWAEETRQAAARYDNEWDRKAVEWDGVLTADSVVVECGSYKGRWALQIANLYPSTIICFEPQKWAFDVSVEVLKEYGYRCLLFPYGLWSENAVLEFGQLGTDGCFGGPMREIEEVLKSSPLHVWVNGAIDLMLINIEGGEYTLIPHMFEQGIFPIRLMVQFHEGDYDGLRALIEQHYDILWDYGRTLAAFVLKRE